MEDVHGCGLIVMLQYAVLKSGPDQHYASFTIFTSINIVMLATGWLRLPGKDSQLDSLVACINSFSL